MSFTTPAAVPFRVRGGVCGLASTCLPSTCLPLRLLPALFVVAGLLAGPLVDEAPAQQPRPGEVAGRVVDFDSTPLPGIGVELVGPFPENTSRATVADINARFMFSGLAPGRYRLSIALADLDAGSDLDVTVRAGARTETTLVLSLLGTGVNVIVQAEAPALVDTDLVDPESTSGERIVPGTTIDRLPLPAEQALEVLPWLPTVVRGAKGQLAIDGTLPTDSTLLFNGIDLMDGYSGDYSVRLPVEAIDSVDLFTGVAPASYGNIAGGIVDITTVPGGESWEWGIASFFPRPRFEDGTIQGIGNASPRINVSGPIKAGETYLSLAGEYHFDRVRVYDIPGDPDQDHIREQGWNAFAQVDWRAHERHSFTIAGLVFPQYDKYVGLDGLTPPDATLNVERDAEAILGRHTARLENNRSIETMLQFNRIGVRSEAQGPDPYRVLTGGFAGNQFHGEDRQTTHFQGRSTFSQRFDRGGGASHLVQFGFDFQRLSLSGDFGSETIEVRGADGRLLQRVDFSAPVTLQKNKYEWAGFVQDRWTLGERFWWDLGLRWENDSFTRDSRFSPRVGAAWDPVGDRRTLIKGGVGLVYRRVYLGEVTWNDLPARLETTFDEDGTRLAVFEPETAGQLHAPRTLLITGDFSHRFESGWMFRTRYSRRQSDNSIVADRIEPVPVSIQPGDDPLAIYAQGLFGRSVGSILLSSSGAASSWSVELTAARRIPTGGQFVVSYVRSSSYGDLNDFTIMTGILPDPIIRPNQRGPREFDAPHRLLAWGTFELPSGVLLTPAAEWRSGFPFSALQEDQSYAGAANQERFPNFFALDLQATKAFEIKGYRVTGGVKITNITGHDNPRQVVANLADPAFGEFRNSVPFRVRMKFGFKF